MFKWVRSGVERPVLRAEQVHDKAGIQAKIKNTDHLDSSE